MGQRSRRSTPAASTRSTSTSTGIRQRMHSLSQQSLRGSPGWHSIFWSKSLTRGCKTAGGSMTKSEVLTDLVMRVQMASNG